MARTRQPPSSKDNAEGTLQHLYSKQSSNALHELFELLGSDSFKRLSNILANHSDFKFIDDLGSGGFGFVFMGRLATDMVAAKLEVLEKPNLASTLEREAQVYSAFSASSRVEDIPLPKTFNAFCFPAGKNHNFFASVPLGSGVTVKLMCLEYLDVEKTRKIWKDAEHKLADDLEVTASLRYLILDTLYALLYLVQKGIAHRDFKLPHHVGFRPHNEQLVVFDFGMAEVDGISYGTSVSRPPTKVNQQGISLGFVAASTTRIEPRFGKDRPGTRGYTAPFVANTLNLGHFTDIWSAAASIVKLFRKCTSDKEGRTEFQRSLIEVVRKNDFKEFLRFALEGKDVRKMKTSCRSFLELAYMMFVSTPIDGLERPSPKDALSSFLFSDFALCYIYEKQETERTLREKGIVIKGKITSKGKHQRPVLLILDIFGLMVLTIFKCKIGDPAGEYCGRIRLMSNGGLLSRDSFSMHSVTVDPGCILDGAPGKDLPLEILIQAGVGSLFMSSRGDPAVSTPGNVSLVPRHAGRTPLRIDGIPLESLQMSFREDVKECTLITWDYKWHRAQSGLGMSDEQVRKAMASNSREGIAAIEERWRTTVMEHRENILKDGEFCDATEDIASSTDGDDITALCRLLGDCTCETASINPARSVDCRYFASFDPDSLPRTGYVWVVPPMISDAELVKLTVVADAHDFSTMDFSTRFSTAEYACGAALVQGLDRIFAADWAGAVSAAESVANARCQQDVFIYQGAKPFKHNPGKKRKKLGYIGEFENDLATYMRKCLKHILPNYMVAVGESIRGSPDQAKTEQCELLKEIPPPEDEVGEVQAIHADASVLNPAIFPRCMDILRANLQLVLDSKGPVSLFFPFTSGYCLVVFLIAHKPAIECLKNFARHYEPMHDAFQKMHPKASASDWKAAWCNFTMRRLRRLFPGQSFEPVCIPVELGEVLAISSFLPHCGVPVGGIRGFIAATYEVPLAMQCRFPIYILIHIFVGRARTLPFFTTHQRYSGKAIALGECLIY